MAINLNDNVFSASPKLLDAKWGPFPDTTAAYAAVLPSFRKIGMFAIISPPAGPAQLYWYKNDTTTLVPFSGNSSVQVYPTYNDFPGTGLVDVIYVDKSTSYSYYWNTSLNPADYTLSGTTVEVYPSLTGSNPGTDSFPTTGVENVIYVASDTDISYIWNPTLLNGNGDYEILIGTAVKERVTYHECNSGTADTYAVSTAAITTNTIGDAYLIKFDVANTGPSTLQMGTGPAASLYNTKTGTTLEAGDLEAGVVHLVVFTSKSPSIFEVLTIGGGIADTGNIGFENNWIKNTVDEEIFISPQDGNTWLWLPSDTQAAAGDYVNLASTDANSAGVYITTNAGSWHFKNDGILEVPGRISFGGLDWQSIGVGNVNTHGGAYGISLFCTVGYELNWQAGYLSARDYTSPYNLRPIFSDSLIKYATPGDYPTFHGTFDDDTLINKKYLEDKEYSGIVTADITNWNTAYGWGNHASVGYITGISSSDVTTALGYTPVPNSRNITINGTTQDLTADRTWTISGGVTHFTVTNGPDTYSVTGITGVTAYNDGDAYLIRFTNGNTGTSTLEINSLGQRALYKNNDGPLIGGDIWAGAEMLCIYNSTLSAFQCIGISPNSLYAYVTNGEAVTITKGQVVYASGGTGDRMVVMLASNSQDSTSAKTVGVVYSTSIGANQKGIILMQGLIDGLGILKPNPDNWADGDSVYLGVTAGSITRTKPSAPNHLVYVATVTTASQGNSGRMYVKIQNGYELDEIHDVQINSGTIATGHYLYYDSAGNGLWKNSASWQGTEIPISKGGTGATTDSGARTNLGLAIGTNVQAYSANLAAIAGLSPTLDNFIVGNGSTWILETPSQARTSIGLGNVENTALSTWAGSTNITTLGTITTGTWSAGTIAVARGGTGLTTIGAKSILVANALDTYIPLTPGAGQSVRINASNTAWEVFTPGVGQGVTTVQTFSGSSQPNGATISTVNITFGPADATNPGMVSTGTQTWAGAKTFSSAVTVSAASNQLAVGSGVNLLTINGGTSAAARTYTVPDAGTSASFVMTTGTQNIGGSKTFTSALTISPITNQLTLGATNSTTINAPNAGGAKTYTIPNVGTTSNFLMSTGAQSFSSILSILQPDTTVASYINLEGASPTGNVTHVEGVTGGISNPPLPSGARLVLRQYTTGYATYIGRPGGVTSADLSSMLFACNLTGSFRFWTAFTENIRFTNNTIAVDNGSGTLQQVIGPRVTGWGAPTGSINRAALTLTAAATYSQTDFNTVIQALKAVITDLRAHGLINN
jgi:hypothetical protein